MRLARFAVDGNTHSGLVEGDRVTAFPGSVKDVLADAVAPVSTGMSWPLAEVTLLAPIPDPGTAYAIGSNYAAHVEEMKSRRNEKPVVFVKVAGAINAPGGPIVKPEVVEHLDYEAELVLVIGAGGTVAGYCVANDVSARDLQSEPQWTRAKGADTFCPYGPWITTADEVPDPGNLWIRSWVNGELRQDANTSLLLFPIDALVAFISETNTLRPGDLILTGTPAGVGAGRDPQTWLGSGDVIRIEVEGLGAIVHPVA
jgi:2-keto-4-pentenoate hydratase/2-oxohepta-3-ene-1,7-dioic acid hydratase in catechol pathway